MNSIGASPPISIGIADSALTEEAIYTYPINWTYDPVLVAIQTGAGANQKATIASMDADGFTLAWVKVGAPTRTGTMRFLCLA